MGARVAVLSLLIVAATSTPSRAHASGEFGRALAFERAGHLGSALAVLRTAHLSRLQASHRAALRRAVVTLAAARIYQRRNQLDMADSVLAGLTKHLDPVRDVYVRAAVQQDMVAIEEELNALQAA